MALLFGETRLLQVEERVDWNLLVGRNGYELEKQDNDKQNLSKHIPAFVAGGTLDVVASGVLVTAELDDSLGAGLG